MKCGMKLALTSVRQLPFASHSWMHASPVPNANPASMGSLKYARYSWFVMPPCVTTASVLSASFSASRPLLNSIRCSSGTRGACVLAARCGAVCAARLSGLW